MELKVAGARGAALPEDNREGIHSMELKDCYDLRRCVKVWAYGIHSMELKGKCKTRLEG